MTSDHAGFRSGVPARFDPDRMRGSLTEAEHIARYRLAAQLVEGKRVLDAGCGTGYGCVLLADAGASEVVGADIAREVLDSVRPAMPATVTLEVADLGALPYGGGDFDLVVCFNVLGQLEDPASALDELVRVLAPDGIVIVSSPNQPIADSNPHERHAYAPEELEAELRLRLPYVRGMRQDVHLTAAVLRDNDFPARGGALEDVLLTMTAAGEPGVAEYAVALAGHAEPPAVSPVAVIASGRQVTSWYGALAEQRAFAAADRARILELEEQVNDLVDLQARVAALEEELRRAGGTLADVTDSASWRLTAPLRRAKRAIARR